MTLLFSLVTQACFGRMICVTNGFVWFHQQLFNSPALKIIIFSALTIFLAANTATQSRNPKLESTLMKCTRRGIPSPNVLTHSFSHVLVHSPHPCKSKQSSTGSYKRIPVTYNHPKFFQSSLTVLTPSSPLLGLLGSAGQHAAIWLETPLHHYITQGQLEHIMLLLNTGTDINHQSEGFQ